MAGGDDDDYRSSDDEDYNLSEGEDELDEADEKFEPLGSDEELEDEEKAGNEKSKAKPEEKESSADVDALFAELTGQDPLLLEIERRKKLSEATKTVPFKSLNTSSLSSSAESSASTAKTEDIESELAKIPETSTASSSTIKTTSEVSKPAPAPKKRIGVMDALQSLTKKSKISVLERSDRDWKQFKTEKQLTEDLESHNRGKGGYLNRMDFLNRTDNRQFEAERDLRAITRKDAV